MRLRAPALVSALLATTTLTALVPLTGPAPSAQAAGTTYYVDAVNGRDTNNGLSTTTAFKTLAKADSVKFRDGDQVLLRRGQTFTGRISVDASMSLNVWGSGTDQAVIKGGKTGPCVDATGAAAWIANIRVTGCGTAGIVLRGTGQRVHQVTVDGNTTTGLRIDPAAVNALVTDSVFGTNATAVVVNGDGTTVRGSRFAGNSSAIRVGGTDTEIRDNTFDSNSYALTIANAQRTAVHHNIAVGDATFARLMTTDAADATSSVTVDYNRHTGAVSSSRFLTLHGAGGGNVGPVTGVKVRNNSVRLTGDSSKAVVCSSGCTTSVLPELRGNVLSSAAAPFTTDGATGVDNVFWPVAPVKGTAAYPYGPGEVLADPMFTDAAAGDLRPAVGSPAVDRVAAPTFTTATADLDGVAAWTGTDALLDGDGNGIARLDAGAFERPTAPPPPAPAPAPTPAPEPVVECPEIGIYQGANPGSYASADDDLIAQSLFGSTPQIANTYYQPTQAINITKETARIKRGTSPNLTITTKGTNWIEVLAAGPTNPDYATRLAWLKERVAAIATLAAVDPNVPVYATLDHEFAVKVRQGWLTGPSADSANYGKVLKLFYHLLEAADPNIRTTYWMAGSNRTIEGDVAAQFTTGSDAILPDVITFDPYATVANGANSITTIVSADLTWIRSKSWYVGQEIGLSEFGMEVGRGDTALAAFFVNARHELLTQGIDWAVFFNRTSTWDVRIAGEPLPDTAYPLARQAFSSAMADTGRC